MLYIRRTNITINCCVQLITRNKNDRFWKSVALSARGSGESEAGFFHAFHLLNYNTAISDRGSERIVTRPQLMRFGRKHDVR